MTWRLRLFLVDRRHVVGHGDAAGARLRLELGPGALDRPAAPEVDLDVVRDRAGIAWLRLRVARNRAGPGVALSGAGHRVDLVHGRARRSGKRFAVDAENRGGAKEERRDQRQG